MQRDQFKEQFLSFTRTSAEEQSAAAPDWEKLAAIHEHHSKNAARLEDVAYLKVRTIQRMTGVHSVRWRVKSPEHLIDKIVRKLADGNSREKYKDISPETYASIVTDLIGLRALHLFKADCIHLHSQINDDFEFAEPAVIYIREGDLTPEALENSGIEARPHKAGYRSIHYILKSARDKGAPDLIELQVRSLYEEAWSEIDHRIRYPNFSNDASVFTALMVLNRFSGNADELASFVLYLKENNASRDLAYDKAMAELKEAASTNDFLKSKVAALEAADKENRAAHVFPGTAALNKQDLKNFLDLLEGRNTTLRKAVEQHRLVTGTFGVAPREQPKN